jgi:branched-subunit amino acid aminotransferase/4-amino-4-deoxychorismate lyase
MTSATTGTQRMYWTPRTGLVPDRPGREVTPQIIDSWLLDEGKVRGLSRHEARFAHGCDQLKGGPANKSVRLFLADVRAALPRRGSWFPRLEADRGERQLALWLRPAPPLQTSTVLWVPSAPDPRQCPTLKGPDLTVLTELRQRANEAGADDALLYLTDGTVLETAHAALLWWRGPVLCLPDQRLPILSSITVELLVEHTHHRGVTVRYERCHLAELAGLTVWTANALHGLRHVSRWTGRVDITPAHTIPGPALHRWRKALQATLTPLTDPRPNPHQAGGSSRHEPV